MADHDETSGRRTRAFWHRFPKDDGWKACTLDYAKRQCFKLEPTCRNCWHRGIVMDAVELAAWAQVPTHTPIIALAARLVCSRCDHPAGYFHLHNPHVKDVR